MAARGKNAKKKSKRRRHAGTRKLQREASAAGAQSRSAPRRAMGNR
jgi:hypothetical protein